MKVTSYGLFWRASEIDWNPGQGNRNSFRLLGRVGANRGTIRIADFRHQQGIYILYDEYGPAYVGLTRAQGLGKRLKDHLDDHLYNKWDRFSWFGFNPIGAPDQKSGVLKLHQPPEDLTDDTQTTIGDLEALLIRCIGPKRNTAYPRFQGAEEWTQIDYDDQEMYLQRLDV
ncbi:GIY-YIG nuclease family protein [Leisingera aquaemixtae]|uniref:GIY-YIG nuclease family protein n=1 Tax=Leisingera aquaemixtae TaxID=1396826 RepID=UPI0021A74CBC|nr:GIY-YIG nuclease family protein [Leisingera aquaemixtae]UWQ38343.1 GIY-YIG nuclease family protein [Leisingera aquaemixtae]